MNFQKIFAAGSLAVFLVGCGTPATPPIATSELLPATEIKTFASPPAPLSADIQPNFVEKEATLANAENTTEVLEMLGLTLTDAEKKYLDENKFLLVDKTRAENFAGDLGMYDEMLGVWDRLGGEWGDYNLANSRLANPDVFLHAFHKFFSGALEAVETTKLRDELSDFLTKTRSLALASADETDEDELENRLKKIAAQLTVPLVLLENSQPTSEEFAGFDEETGMPIEPTPDNSDTLENATKIFNEKYAAEFSDDLKKKILGEMKLIYAAEGMANSPLWGSYKPNSPTDYTQFSPRGHYNKDSILRGYFRAMMYLGRFSYFFETDDGIRDAILASEILGGAAVDEWTDVMEVTGFFAGESDDLVYDVWQKFLAENLTNEELQPAEVATSDEAVATVRENLSKLPQPKILSDVIVDPEIEGKSKDELLASTLGFRIFGQRFNYDGWILNQLTAGDENPDFPSMPTALFVPAAFGNEFAEKNSREFLLQTFAEEDSQLAPWQQKLDNLKVKVGSTSETEKFSSLATAWLFVLDGLNQTFGDGYPAFMRSPNFLAKAIETWLGSYTELKHDTILYAKQSYAEMGAGGPDEPPPTPHGLVEPNQKFWNELSRLTDFTIDGFTKHQILPRTIEEYGRLGNFKKSVDFARSLAEKELKNEAITEEEYLELRGLSLEGMAAPLTPGKILDDEDRMSALVADIHTDAVNSEILYEATARPQFELVLVGDGDRPRLVVGTAFDHREFTRPLEKRLNDEEWKKEVYAAEPQLPEKNFWYDGLSAK